MPECKAAGSAEVDQLRASLGADARSVAKKCANAAKRRGAFAPGRSVGWGMAVIPLTLAISLGLAVTFVVFFLREHQRGRRGGAERDSLLRAEVARALAAKVQPGRQKVQPGAPKVQPGG